MDGAAFLTEVEKKIAALDDGFEEFDDLTEEEINDLLAEKSDIPLEKGHKRTVVMTGLPIVDEKKAPKLLQVLKKKTFKDYLKDVYTGDLSIELVWDDAHKETTGYAFLTFATPTDASAFCTAFAKKKFDKKHTLTCHMFEDIDKYANVSDEYEKVKVAPFVERTDLFSWLLDTRGLDQYVIRYQDETEIFWNENIKGQKPVPVYGRKFWTDTYVVWSPYGSYLTTFHGPGVILWGGDSWTKMARLAHPNVKLVSYSPCEKYIITISVGPGEKPTSKEAAAETYIVWDVLTGKKLRSFPYVEETASMWPKFKWSFSDEFVSAQTPKGIAIYELPSMQLLEKRTLKVPHLVNYEWSPGSNVIAYWKPEAAHGAQPASVTLIEISTKSRVELRQRNLFQVVHVELHWQSSGDYLCARVTRHTKNKKKEFETFEIFRLNESGIPIETFDPRATVTCLAWEPKGRRFGMVHGPMGKGNGKVPEGTSGANSSASKNDVSFYEIPKGKPCKRLGGVERKAVNMLFWSPRGSMVVLAGLKAMNGMMEFYNVNDMASMGYQEHYMTTDIEWDPTGRYVCSFVSAWRQEMDNGYNIYDFRGKRLQRVVRDRFFQFMWRPRPPTLLSKEELRKISKNLSKYQKKYDQEDQERMERQKREFMEKMAAKQRSFTELEAAKRAYWTEQLVPKRPKVEIEYVTEESEVETLLSEEVIVLEEEKE